MNRWKRTGFCIACVLLAGCSEPGAEKAAPVASYPEVGIDTAWVSDPAQEFSFIVGMAPSPSGGMFVLDMKESTVTELTASGKFARKYGSKGEGPGEFSRPRTVGLHADSLWVGDAGLKRVTLFALDGGGGVATGSPNAATGPFNSRPYFEPAGLMADGSLIVSPPARFGVIGEMRKDTLFQIVGGVWSAIGTRSRGGAWNIPNGNLLKQAIQPFQYFDGFAIAPDGSSVVQVEMSAPNLMNNARFVVTRRDFRDQTQWTFEVPYSPRRLEQKSIDSVVQLMTKDSPAQFDLAKDSLFGPAAWPPVRGFLVSRSGEVWVHRFDSNGNRWQSISPDSAQRRMVSLPANFQPMLISRDSVWGVMRDENDVPRVALMTLEMAGVEAVRN